MHHITGHFDTCHCMRCRGLVTERKPVDTHKSCPVPHCKCECARCKPKTHCNECDRPFDTYVATHCDACGKPFTGLDINPAEATLKEYKYIGGGGKHVVYEATITLHNLTDDDLTKLHRELL